MFACYRFISFYWLVEVKQNTSFSVLNCFFVLLLKRVSKNKMAKHKDDNRIQAKHNGQNEEGAKLMSVISDDKNIQNSDE